MKKTDNDAGYNFAYMVRCSDDSLYTGWTNDIARRIRAHNSGAGAKYTRNRGPVELVYLERFDSKEEAMSREYRIKRLPRMKKMELLSSEDNIAAGYKEQIDDYNED